MIAGATPALTAGATALDARREPAKHDYRIPASSAWRGAWKKSAAVGAAGLAASFYGCSVDPRRFGLSYLVAMFAFLGIGLGALFFVLVQHLTKAEWSVTVRRSAELLMCGLPAFVLLVVPLLADVGHVYPWAGYERAPAAQQSGAFANAADEGSLEPAALARANEGSAAIAGRAQARSEALRLAGKGPYMNRPFFVARAMLFVLLWAWLARRLFRWSTEQDATGAHRLTAAAQRFAPPATVVFAITIVFASIDWLMSLDPTWYSTIFGVYVFSSAAVAGSAALIVLTFVLRRSGLLGGTVTVEHYHDMGKLLFGWLAFWAYLAYVQFFLSWYANIPDEVAFFHLRWNDNLGTWKAVSASLALGRFAVPFWLLMSRNVKRNVAVLTAAAALLLVSHVVELYWIVMPNGGPLALHWLDATCLAGVGGTYLAVVLRAMERHALVPIGDPRLDRSLEFENA